MYTTLIFGTTLLFCLEGCPYFTGVHISEVSLFQRCPYSRGVLISEVSLFQGCPYFRGVLISDLELPSELKHFCWHLQVKELD